MTIAAKIGALLLAPFMMFSGMNHTPLASTNTPPVHPSERSESNNGLHLGAIISAFMHQRDQDDEHPVSTSTPLSITNIVGPATLAVNQSGTWRVNVNETSTSTLHYSVVWGDEGSAMRALNANEALQSSATFTHTYATAGTYTPTFTVKDDQGHVVTKAASSVQVGKMAPAHITAINPASGAPGVKVTLTGTGFTATSTVTFGNTATSSVLHDDGTLAFYVASTTQLGWYPIRVNNGSGLLSNTVWFHVTAPVSAHLSVNGVDAPATLKVNEDGTWTVHASSNVSGNLHYSVVWGDENGMMRALSSVLPHTTQSSATFSHAYSDAGTYEPKFTITDDAGDSVSTSASVLVTNQ